MIFIYGPICAFMEAVNLAQVHTCPGRLLQNDSLKKSSAHATSMANLRTL